jgi:undecaprenyl-diphosphatase
VLVAGSVFLYLLVAIVGIRVYGTATPLRVDARADRVFTSPRITGALAEHHLARLQSSRFLGHLVDLGAPQTVIILSLLLAAVAFTRRDAAGVLLCALAPLAAGVLTELVGKPLVDRTLGRGVGVYPSGHVTGAAAVAAVAVALAYRYGGRRAAVAVVPVAALLPLLVSVGVIGRAYHYATDAIGGLAVGVATAIVAVLVIDAIERYARARVSAKESRRPLPAR